jgi:hypothetical protein
MDLANKNSEEIQQEIFKEIAKGTNIESLKAEIKQKGLHPEGFYFMSEQQRNIVKDQPIERGGHLTTSQIIWGVITVVLIIFRIARCSSKM